MPAPVATFGSEGWSCPCPPRLSGQRNLCGLKQRNSSRQAPRDGPRSRTESADRGTSQTALFAGQNVEGTWVQNRFQKYTPAATVASRESNAEEITARRNPHL